MQNTDVEPQVGLQGSEMLHGVIVLQSSHPDYAIGDVAVIE